MADKGKIADKKNHKRERIIEAAAKLFSEKSFHEVMMEDVARMASIAKGTLYNYFASKEDLYFSIMLTRMTSLISSLKEGISREARAVESLHLYVVHNYMFMIKYSCFFIMFQKDNLNAESSTSCAEFRERKAGLFDTLKEIISRGVKENVFFTDDPEFAAQVVLGSIYAAVNRAISMSYTKEEITQERERLFDFILKGLSLGTERKLPLESKTIVITRAEEDSKESASLFSSSGAEVLLFPTLEVVPPESWNAFDQAVKELTTTDYLIFTSANAVKMFVKRCAELGLKPDYTNLKVLAIGKKTCLVCEKHGIQVSMVPKEFSAAGLAAGLSEADIKGNTVFIPSSAIARGELPEALRQMGAVVRTAEAYNIALPSPESISIYRDKLKRSKPDLFIFTSPSSFRNFLEIMEVKEAGKYFESFLVAAIGPTTASEIEKAGLNVDILPKEYTMEGLLRAVTDYYLISKTA
ncbi:MAG TPA: uroporphyrinogen-III synthase [Ignavibacteriales bacterium]|nr:uroporphyrinogen-III synthase [Ignavibacteriales bacterium]